MTLKTGHTRGKVIISAKQNHKQIHLRQGLPAELPLLPPPHSTSNKLLQVSGSLCSPLTPAASLGK